MKTHSLSRFIALLAFYPTLSALEHGDTFVLKRGNPSVYLSVGIPNSGGTAQTADVMSINSLTEETSVKATSRWTIRKVGFGTAGVAQTINSGDKILLENTATGFYIKATDNQIAYRYETGQIGTTSQNWEDPGNIITWADTTATEITLFKKGSTAGTTYTIDGKMSSVASSATSSTAINQFLNEIRGCSIISDGLKTLTAQVSPKDANGNTTSYLFGLSASNGTLYQTDSGKPIAIQNRFPLYSTNPKYINGVLVPNLASVDVDKLGNIVVGDADYFPTALAPWKSFVPLTQKLPGLLATPGVPTTLYPDADPTSAIIKPQEQKEPWHFIRALNPIKFARFTNANVLHAVMNVGGEQDLDPVQYFSAYQTDFMQGAKANLRMRNCKVGNGKVVARPAFSSSPTPLLFIPNIDTSDTVTSFVPNDTNGKPMNTIDYDVDDKGVIWVLNDAGEIYHYKNGETANGTKAAVPTPNIFENSANSLLDRPCKMSVASSAGTDPDLICISLVSSAGQLAVGLGDYTKLNIKNLSNLSANPPMYIVGVVSASVATDGTSSSVIFVTENKTSTGISYLNWKGLIGVAGQALGITTQTNDSDTAMSALSANCAAATPVPPATTSGFIPPTPKPTPTPAQVQSAGYSSCETRGFALLRYPFAGGDQDPGWPNRATHRQYKISLVSKQTPDGRDFMYKANKDGGGYALRLSNQGDALPNGTRISDTDQSIIDSGADVFYLGQANEIAAATDNTVCALGRPNGVFLMQQPTGPLQLIGFQNEALLKVAVGSATNIWVLHKDNTVSKYDTKAKTWTPVPNVQAQSIAGSSDGAFWFVDMNGIIKLYGADGTTTTLPGGDTTPVSMNPYNTSAASQQAPPAPAAPTTKFFSVSAAGSASGEYRLVAITLETPANAAADTPAAGILYSCDQGRPLESEQVTNVAEACVAMSGMCSIVYPIDKSNGSQVCWGGRTYIGWIKGENPVTHQPYMPKTWPYVAQESKTDIPDNAAKYIDPLPYSYKSADIASAYSAALAKGFVQCGSITPKDPTCVLMDPTHPSDKALHCCQKVSVVTGLNNCGYDHGYSNKIYKNNGQQTGSPCFELNMDPTDPSLVINWPCPCGGVRDIAAGVDGTVCVLWWSSTAVSMLSKAGATLPGAGTNLGFDTLGGAAQIAVANAANIWGRNPAGAVYKYTGSGTNWTPTGLGNGVKANYIAGGADGTFWFIDGQGNLQSMDPNGKITPFPGGQGLNLVKVSAAGTGQAFHLVALDNAGSLFSANQANPLTAEGMTKIKEASVAQNGATVIVFIINSESPYEVLYEGGVTMLGWTQWAQKPANWMHPIPRLDLVSKTLAQYNDMVPQYNAIEAKGFAPAGSRTWVVWTHRAFTDRTIHSQFKVAVATGLTGPGVPQAKMFKVQTGAGVSGKCITELPLNNANYSAITGWRMLNKSDSIRELAASYDGNVAAVWLDASYILVWRTGTDPFLQTDPVLNIPTPFKAINLAFGGFNGSNCMLWALGIDNKVYKYTNTPANPWKDVGLQARAIGTVGELLHFVDMNGTLQWCGNPDGTGVNLYPGGDGKDLRKLCVSGTGPNHCVVAIGGPTAQLYSSYCFGAATPLTAEAGVNYVTEAAVSHQGFAAVVFRINQLHPFEYSGGAPAYMGWIQGTQPKNWNNRA